jgi:hypothetical protein
MKVFGPVFRSLGMSWGNGGKELRSTLILQVGCDSKPDGRERVI